MFIEVFFKMKIYFQNGIVLARLKVVIPKLIPVKVNVGKCFRDNKVFIFGQA